MRLPMFLAAAVAAWAAAAQQLYTEPTYAQVERLVGAVQEAGGEPGAYTAAVARAGQSLYGKPTYAQVERLIGEVRASGSALADALSPSNVALRIAQDTGIHIGEPNVKTQYVRGVWAATGTPVDPSTGDRTVEIGINAHATETNSSNQSVAIGRDSLANNTATVAVGPNSFADGDRSVAVGWRANAIGERSVSIGTANKSGQNYYIDGQVNPASDLQLAEGPYSVAIGYNDKAKGHSSIAIGNDTKATTNDAIAVGREALVSGTSAIAVGRNAASSADGAVQIGSGTNSAPHTLKFENVTVVKDGQVVGSSVPDPQTVSPDRAAPGSDYDYTLSLSPGSITTLLPESPMDGGEYCAVDCTGRLRNFTLYLPNEPEVREAMPVGWAFELPTNVRHSVVGPQWISRLPCRCVVEQPYPGLAVLYVTELDDGSDWTPAITNCNLAFRADGHFVTTNGAASLQGVNLHCATAFELSYQPAAGTVNTVSFISLPEGQTHFRGSLYGSFPPVDCAVTETEIDLGSLDHLPAVIRYKTINGTTEYHVNLDIIN